MPSRFEPISLHDKENDENDTLEEPPHSDKIIQPAPKDGSHKTPSPVIKGKIVKRGRGRPKKIQIIKNSTLNKINNLAIAKSIAIDLDKVLSKLIIINKDEALPKLTAINVNKSFRNLREDSQDIFIYYIPDPVLGKRPRDEEDDVEQENRIKIRILIIQIIGVSVEESVFAAGINNIQLINLS